jgi:hypothetical protein
MSMKSTVSPFTRRQFLRRSTALGGACAGYGLMGQLMPSLAAASPDIHPLAPRAPHFPAKAKRAIMFFLTGGLSHIDSFDPKPELRNREGQELRKGKRYMGSPWQEKPCGSNGTMMTDLFPELSKMADEYCLIRSMHGNHGDHFEATLHMHTGSNGAAMPSMGSWISYGLGSENPNLPSHIVFARDKPYAGAQVWDSNFLPAYHQGMRIIPGHDPIPNLKSPAGTLAPVRDLEMGLLDQLNQRHLLQRESEGDLAARMLSFQTAANLQELAPQIFDLGNESDQTMAEYGVERGDQQSFAWQTLVARRMLESGVRFVELIDTGASRNWDAHGNIKSHEGLAKKIDQPIAAFLRDMELRGLLEDTLVIFTTEFGRTADGANNGRDHHAHAFSSWLAGAGVQKGLVHGATDELGMQITADPVHVHDFHATILHLLGLDHKRLTYHHGGRDFRLTDVHGRIVSEILT